MEMAPDTTGSALRWVAMEKDSDTTALRRDLSDVNFANLAELRERIGTKRFIAEVLGSSVGDKASTRRHRPTVPNTQTSRDAPMEISSKRPVRSNKKHDRPIRRDPRFDSLNSEFNEEKFNNSYSFIFDMESRDRKLVSKELKKCKNEGKKGELRQLLNRLETQSKVRKDRQTEREIRRDIKEKEIEKIQQGKKPFFLNETSMRRLVEKRKTDMLKESGKFDKVMAKKTQRREKRMKSRIPFRRKRDS